MWHYYTVAIFITVTHTNCITSSNIVGGNTITTINNSSNTIVCDKLGCCNGCVIGLKNQILLSIIPRMGIRDSGGCVMTIVVVFQRWIVVVCDVEIVVGLLLLELTIR